MLNRTEQLKKKKSAVGWGKSDMGGNGLKDAVWRENKRKRLDVVLKDVETYWN